MNTWRVFVDANILFSASLRRGTVATLMEALRLRHEAVSCPLAVGEARRNLEQKQVEALPGLEMALARVRMVPEHPFSHGFNLPSNDSLLLGSAIAAGCTHFLSGDKRHFGPLYGRRIEGVLVVNPRMLLLDKYLL